MQKTANIQIYIQQNADLLKAIFDNQMQMYATVHAGLLKIAKKRWNDIKHMFSDFGLKDFIIYGDIASYVYNPKTEVSIGIVVSSPEQVVPYLPQINFAFINHELPYKFIQRPIHCHILNEIPKNEPSYSLQSEKWINLPQKREYPFTMPEFYRSFEKYMDGLSDFIESLPKHKNKILTPEGVEALEDYLNRAKEKALTEKTNSVGGEYSKEYLLWRTFSDIGELDIMQKYAIDSYNYNINELNQC